MADGFFSLSAGRVGVRSRWYVVTWLHPQGNVIPGDHTRDLCRVLVDRVVILYLVKLTNLLFKVMRIDRREK